MGRLLTVAFIAVIRLAAATVEVHSEFLRVDPHGEILSSDRAPTPREIISPAVVRNGFASFQVVVRSPRPTNYFLFVSANPPDVLRATLYKEKFVKRGDDWIPDALTPLRAPNFDAIPQGQTACAYLLDVWAPPETPVSTIRLEVQLKVGVWVIYPMEVRVLPALVPEMQASAPQALPGIEERADRGVEAPLFDYLDGHAVGMSRSLVPRTVREVIRRNAEQDMALAQLRDSKTLIPALKKKVAGSDGGGEWYLGIRDIIYRLGK